MRKHRLLSCGILMCLSLFLSVSAPAQSAAPQALQNAANCFATLDNSGNFADNLQNADMNNLPSGIKKTVNNMEVTLAVNSADLTASGYTSLGVYLRINIPEKNKTLFFGGKDIKLSREGDIIGDAKVVLMGDLDIPVNENITLRLKGGFDENAGTSQDLTFASIDCEGFKEMGVSAEVELSRELCLPVDGNGNVIRDEAVKVAGKFRTQVSDWSDITAQVSFPAFMIKGLDDFVWTVKDATFDFSDYKTPQGIFPDRYRQFLVPGMENLWRGVYVSELSVMLPPQFSKKDGIRTSFDARNMLIDENGVTGTFGANGELLSINEGNANGWQFSVERFALTLLANNLEGAEFAGQIGLPVSEKTKLYYDGLIGANNKYMLRVQSVDSLSFDFLGATAQLDPNSYVEFKAEDKKFKPEAMLHGRMGVSVKLKPEDGKEAANLKGVEFRSLRLKTERPYLSVEYFGYNGEVKLMNFPLSISDIALTANDTQAALGFNAKLSLGDIFTGETRLEIVGAMAGGELHRWRYERVEVSQIKVDARIAETFYLKGELDILRDDPVYGDGFGGKVEMGFEKVLKGLKVTVRGMFGKTDFRYWFVDGMAELPGTGITVFPPAFNLIGFGGGVSYRMKPDLSKSGGGSPLSSTSVVYVPDANTTLGIKASAMFAVPKREVIQGEATFELSFNNNGGLSYAGFYGYAKFAGAIPGTENFQKTVNDKYAAILAKEQEFTKGNPELTDRLKQMKQYNANEAAGEMTDKSKVQGQGGIMATVGIQYNFSENSFHASFELYVSMLNGFLQGTGNNNRAGYAVLHIDPQQWYAHMGTPADRIGLRLGVGGASVETGSYLMVGTNIPAAPGLPAQVADMLGEEPANLDYMSGLNALGEGRGFAFGSSLNISTGDLTFLILYANYSMGMGFDVMLKDYGYAQCKGHSGAIGLDGWYASGQAYAYMHGELGVKVNLWFVKGKFPIISADIAALMQAMLPNPSSFKAYLAARAEILGGLVNVNCRFKISVGEVCELVIPGGSPLDMAMISDVSPSDGAGEISVFTAPQATFNMAMDKAFNVQDDEGEKTFRIRLKDFTLNDGGGNIVGELKWNKAKDAVSFYSHEILPPEKTVTATVRVVFEEMRGGRWSPVYTSGKEAEETRTAHFVTSDAPKDIPLENIAYAYPVIDQKFFLKDETKSGYIQLQWGQSYLFPEGMKNQAVYEDEKGNRQAVDFTYNQAQNRIVYSIPEINAKTAYSLKLVSFNVNGQSSEDGKTVSENLYSDEETGSIDINKKQAAAGTRTDVGQRLLSYGFASSAYATMREKINAIVKKEAVVEKISSDLLSFKYETETMEPFDVADLAGVRQTENKPLIKAWSPGDDYYYAAKIYPLIYSEYPVAGRYSVSRQDVEETGVPPLYAVPVISEYLTMAENGNFTGMTRYTFPYRYNLPLYYKADFVDLQSQVVNGMMREGGAAYSRFVSATFPFISAGQYRIYLRYTLPGGAEGSSAIFEYRNFIE